MFINIPLQHNIGYTTYIYDINQRTDASMWITSNTNTRALTYVCLCLNKYMVYITLKKYFSIIIIKNHIHLPGIIYMRATGIH